VEVAGIDMRPPVIEFSIASDRGLATLAVLAAVKRWLRTRDIRESYGPADRKGQSITCPPIWPLVQREQQALKDLEEAARKLELAK